MARAEMPLLIFHKIYIQYHIEINRRIAMGKEAFLGEKNY